MACYHPLTAYRSHTEKTKNGKSVICFNRASVSGSPFDIMKLPCGQCIGCQIARSRDWALRCCHEASLYQNNCFITLTFNDDYINDRWTLVKSDFQKFMKRLRKEYPGVQPVNVDGSITYPIRFFHVGEYGSLLSRPHHHALLFNFDFPDKVIYDQRDNVTLYRSPSLEKLWPYGFCTIGEVNFASAAYCARYCTKKKYGDYAASHYVRTDESTGEVYYLEPEYITMSNRSGIGRGWYDKYKSDLYPKDFITFAGRKLRVPSYYDKIYDRCEPDKMLQIKYKRKLAALANSDNNNPRRLKAGKLILEKKAKNLIREYETQ